MLDGIVKAATMMARRANRFLSESGTYPALIYRTIVEWNKDKVPRLGAALAFYSVFSLAPLFMIAVSISGMVFGEEAARGKIFKEVEGLVGAETAAAVQEIVINSSQEPTTSVIASVIGLVTLLLGASGVFGQLKQALNTIWDVHSAKGGGFFRVIRDRFLSFAMVLGLGFLLLVSLLVSAGIAAMTDSVNQHMPIPDAVAGILDLAVSIAIVTVIFAMIFKVLPDLKIRWKDVWVGAALTSVLFSTGKYFIGLYLGRSAVTSSFGAAGSFVIILLWVYYSSQILLFGAEFTQVYATSRSRFSTLETPLKRSPKTRSK